MGFQTLHCNIQEGLRDSKHCIATYRRAYGISNIVLQHIGGPTGFPKSYIVIFYFLTTDVIAKMFQIILLFQINIYAACKFSP